METPELTVFSSGLPTSEIGSETRAWVESRDLSYSGTAESGKEYASLDFGQQPRTQHVIPVHISSVITYNSLR